VAIADGVGVIVKAMANPVSTSVIFLEKRIKKLI
jgi:hypothetical protein